MHIFFCGLSILTFLLGALLFIYSCAKTLVSLKRWREGGGKRSTAEHPNPFFFWCVKSLLLCGFSIAFCLSWCLLHNSTQDALQARRERQRESQRAGWKGMYGGWALKSKLKQNKHWESVITEWRCFVMFACSCASIWTKWKRSILLPSWIHCV